MFPRSPRQHAPEPGPTGRPKLLEVTGVVFGLLAARLMRSRPPLVSVTVFAQTADMVLFAFINPEGERNPLAHVLHEMWLGAVGDLPFGLTTWLAVVVMLSLKMCLIAYLVWAAPLLGRFRLPVLVAATAAGILGASSNFLATRLFVV